MPAPRLTLRGPVPADALSIASAIRPWDMVECAMHNVDPERYLLKEMGWGEHGGRRLLTLEIDGAPVAMGGARPYAPGRGIVWMLGTTTIEEKPRLFWQASKRFFGRVTEGFSVLENYIPERRQDSRRWLLALGFTFGQPYRHISGVSVVPFSWARPVAA